MRYFIPCILLVLTTCLCADEPKNVDEVKAILAELRNSIEVLRNQGQAAVARTEKTFDKEAEKLKKKALKSLKVAMDDAFEAKDLDGAVALRELIKNTENLDAGNVTKSTIVVNEVKKTEPKAEAPPKPSIPKDAVQFGGHRYLLVKENVSWHHAKSKANQLGGHLLRLDSVIEHDFIITYLSSFKPSYKHVHIDGNREFDLQIWRYEDGTPVDFTKVRRGSNFTPSGPILTGATRKNYVHSCLYEDGGWSVGCLNPSDLGNFIIEWDN